MNNYSKCVVKFDKDNNKYIVELHEKSSWIFNTVVNTEVFKKIEDANEYIVKKICEEYPEKIEKKNKFEIISEEEKNKIIKIIKKKKNKMRKIKKKNKNKEKNISRDIKNSDRNLQE